MPNSQIQSRIDRKFVALMEADRSIRWALCREITRGDAALRVKLEDMLRQFEKVDLSLVPSGEEEPGAAGHSLRVALMP